MERRTAVEREAWLAVLPGWSLVAAGLIVALFVTFFVGLGPPDTSLGERNSDLLAAARSPAVWRLFATFDALGWLGIGGVLFILGLLLRPGRPVAGSLIAVCGVGQIIGALGGFLRLVAVTTIGQDLASGNRAAALAAFLPVFGLISACFVLGGLLGAAGFLMAGVSGRRDLPEVPGWVWPVFVLMGILALTFEGLGAWGGPNLFPLLLLYLVLVVASFAAIGMTLRRRARARAPSER